jgi:hypothetical protein
MSAPPVAYPLQWPSNLKRSSNKEYSRFKTTLPASLKNVQDSLRRFGVDSGKAVANVVISSNYTLGDESPDDGGVAVYFVWDGLSVCIAVDRYKRIEWNLQAVHHIVEARRTELRHGTLQMVRASFTGLAALPPPTPGRPWWAVLGITQKASILEIQEAFRRLAHAKHPDRGGTASAMAELNRARQEALEART